MKKALDYFAGSLIATMFYSALIQYSNTGTADFVELILIPEAWILQ